MSIISPHPRAIQTTDVVALATLLALVGQLILAYSDPTKIGVLAFACSAVSFLSLNIIASSLKSSPLTMPLYKTIVRDESNALYITFLVAQNVVSASISSALSDILAMNKYNPFHVLGAAAVWLAVTFAVLLVTMALVITNRARAYRRSLRKRQADAAETRRLKRIAMATRESVVAEQEAEKYEDTDEEEEKTIPEPADVDDATESKVETGVDQVDEEEQPSILTIEKTRNAPQPEEVDQIRLMLERSLRWTSLSQTTRMSPRLEDQETGSDGAAVTTAD